MPDNQQNPFPGGAADLITLRKAVAQLRQEARSAINHEHHAHGYGSLRFADYRAGWLSLEDGLSRLFPEKR